MERAVGDKMGENKKNKIAWYEMKERAVKTDDYSSWEKSKWTSKSVVGWGGVKADEGDIEGLKYCMCCGTNNCKIL